MDILSEPWIDSWNHGYVDILLNHGYIVGTMDILLNHAYIVRTMDRLLEPWIC